MAAPGALIADRYRLVRQLGAGGMGVVWQAHDERLNRPVAVKQLRTQPGLTDAETDLIAQRAMREARINARLHHPHAVAVYDVVEHQGQPCIVMELVPSVPLTEVMRGLGALTAQEAARVGSQVAAALAAAHALGIVHRDVKPGNVLIGDDGAARICDFGISRALDDTTLTMTGMITGTPAYLAPETARGQQSTPASDVFSLGATLYAAVQGEPPFGTEGNAIAVLYRVTAGDLTPPEKAGPLRPLIVAMMDPEPQHRPSMATAAAQLSTLAAGGAGPLPPDSSDQTLPTPRHNPARISSAPIPSGTTFARPSAGTPGNPEQPTPIPTATATLAAKAPAAGRRRPGLIAAFVALALLAATTAVVQLLPIAQRPTPGSDNPSKAITTTAGTNSAPAQRTSARQSVTPSSEVPAPTATELARAVIDYYGLLPDDTDAAWNLLTPSYQRQTGGRDSYRNFWNGIDTITVTAVNATAPDRAQATLTYVQKSGDRQSTERRSFQLVPSNGALKINQSSVI